MKKLMTLLLSIYLGMPLCSIAQPLHDLHKNDQAIQEYLLKCFPTVASENIHIKPLKGGLSLAKLFKLEVNHKSYVLRILQSLELNDQDSLELFCLIEAAKKELSPEVICISDDHRMVLMEFIDGNTLTIDQANLPNNVFKIARAIYEAHQINGHNIQGESLLSKSLRCAPIVLSDYLAPKNEIEHACELIKTYSQALNKYEYAKVRVHGDLNPRNIFLANNKILLIDWAETTYEDPFYDLAYFSLKADYTNENEWLLLTSYLGRIPTEKEWERFEIHKKIHHAFWSLTDLYLAKEELNQHPEQQIDSNNPPKNWGTYQRLFADSLEELSAQYFYDLSRLNYQLANPKMPNVL